MARIGIDGVLLGTSLTSGHTISAITNIQATLIELSLTNHDSVDRWAEVQFIKNGQSAGNLYKVIAQQAGTAIGPGEEQIYRFNQFLETGDDIQWKASAAGVITAKLSVLEELPATGISWINVDGILLPSTIAIGHTINTGVQSTLIELVLLNIDTSVHRVDFHMLENGGSIGDANRVIGHQSGEPNEIQPGETQIYRWNQYLGDGDSLRWKADTADKIAAKLSIQEENV